ncbi:response regulator [Solicola gregarius]|uniref:Response regulator transcription factor n=1 Tax=Solicola gregarius TaxID=2908642 RepID=A0AA46TLS2_9ACTN|nr:response regulator transcription factor [Solicola gregarius]UYM07621.1 response regulator transcription factor [Solicola gregarius]
MTIRVLLVDDEYLIRSGLRAIVDSEDDLEVVAEASDGTEVLPLVRSLRPDVVMMDVRMPTMNGIDTTRMLIDKLDDPPAILVVTTYENDEYVYDALRVGARGFVLKRITPEGLIEAIRVVAKGESLLFPAAVRQLVAAQADKRKKRELPALTDREGEILRLMATGASNAEIAKELYITVETVKTHVGNVLAKLGARDRTQAVIAAYESGFVEA